MKEVRIYKITVSKIVKILLYTSIYYVTNRYKTCSRNTGELLIIVSNLKLLRCTFHEIPIAAVLSQFGAYVEAAHRSCSLFKIPQTYYYSQFPQSCSFRLLALQLALQLMSLR